MPTKEQIEQAFHLAIYTADKNRAVRDYGPITESLTDYFRRTIYPEAKRDKNWKLEQSKGRQSVDYSAHNTRIVIKCLEKRVLYPETINSRRPTVPEMLRETFDEDITYSWEEIFGFMRQSLDIDQEN